MKDPGAFGQPATVTDGRWASGSYQGAADDSGGVHTNSGVSNKAAYLITEGTRLEPTGSPFLAHPFTGLTDNAGNHLTGDANGDGETADRTQVLHKVAALYYALESLMTPYSTYADLYHLLPQACSSLVATSPVGPLGLTFRSEDCDAVSSAVAATEMDKAPSAAAARPRPMPAMCTNRGAPTVLWNDGFESPSASAAKWLVNPTPGDAQAETAWFTNPPAYGVFPRSGQRNLWGDDPGSPQLLTAQLNTSIRPTPQTYLWFAHAYAFDDYADPVNGLKAFFDGGQVQYSANGGTWTDAGALLVNNGYTGTIESGYQNPYEGRHAFVGSSAGYTASRLDLTSLAGKSVRIRFVVASDEAVGNYGWFIDDVNVYTCNPTTLTVTRPRTLGYGASMSLGGQLTRAGTKTPLAGRTIVLYQRNHGTSTWGPAVRSTRTGSTGAYAFGAIRPGGNTDYLVEFMGASPLAPSLASTHVAVAPRVTLNVNDRTAYRGQLLHLTGSVSPNHHGQKVSLQRYLGGGRWSTITTATLSPTSGYSLWWRPGYAVTYTVRVLKPADSDHAAAASSSTTISVR